MDKYEYRVRAEEINALIDKKEYAEAVKIADTIDWRRVKSVMMLCKVSDLYKMNRRYEDSKEVLLLAYDRHPGGRKIIYSLCELCIKLEEIVQAVEYYKEFVQVAPRDTGRFVLQYRLYEAQDVSLEERIAVLEEYKKRDYREKWAYELAYLYHRIGLATRCVEECDELILWFGEGRYVIKAMELKMLHEPLTPAQQEKYDRRLARRAAKRAEAEEALQTGQTANIDVEGEPNIASMTLPISIKAVEASNAPTAKIPSRKVQEGLDEPEESTNTDEQMMSEEEMDEAEEIAKTQSISQKELNEALAASGEDNSDEPEESDEEETPREGSPDTSEGTEDDLDIQIKTIDVGEYNTINLQQELAKNLAKMLAEEDMEAADATKALPIDTILESTDPQLIKGVTDDSIKNAIVAPLLQDTAEMTPITEEDLLASLDEKPKTMEEIGREEEMAVSEEEVSNDGEAVVDDEEPAADTDRGVTGVTSAIQATVQNMDEVLNTSGAEEPDEPEVPKEQHLSREELMRVISERAARGRNGAQNSQEEEPILTVEAQNTVAEERPYMTDQPVMESQPLVEQQAVEPPQPSGQPVTESQPLSEQQAAEPSQSSGQPVTESQPLSEQQAAELPQPSGQPVTESQPLSEQPAAEPPQLSEQQAAELQQTTPQPLDQLEQQMINEQISGQLSFTDIMAEWEETKKASEEKHREEMRQRMIRQTGPMFADFDAVARASVSSDLNLISPMEDVFQATTDMATEAEAALKADLPTEEKAPAETDHMFEQAQIALQQKEQREEENRDLEEEPVKTKIFNTAEIRDIEKQLLNNLQKENNRVEPELVTPVIPETAPIPVVPELQQETGQPAAIVSGQEISEQNAEYTLNSGISQSPETVKQEPRLNAIVETGDIEFTDLTQEEETASQTQTFESGRRLTKQEKELFGSFAQTETVERQIASAIDHISLVPSTGNVLITGTAGTGTLTVAKNLIKIVQASNAQFSHKVAKITGSILNKKDINTTLGSLVNGALIVERAGDLTPQVCEGIVNYLNGLPKTQGFLMLLEDTKGNIDKLMGVYPQMTEIFNNRIDVAALDNDALVNYGKEYAKVQDYAIDDMGTLALYTRIADMQTRDHHVTVEEVKSIVDEAIMNASKKSVSHFVDVIFAKRYDSEDMIVLREKDFLKDR